MANNKVKVSDLAKSLGMTNVEMLELCKANNVAAKTPQSTLVEAFVPMLKRKAQLAGLVRDVVVEEEKPVKKAAAKAVAPVVETPAAAPVVETPAVVAPVVKKPAAVKPVVEKPAVAPVAETPVVAPPVVDVPVPKSATVISARATAPRDVTREVPRPPATDRTDSQPRPAATGGAPAAPTARQAPPPPGRPVSPTGRPVPPPPGRPMSATGRPVPPPPGGPRTAPAPSARPSGTGYGGPRTGAPRPAGAYGAPRPGAGPRPAGAFGAPRPGGPGGAPGAPGGAPGGPGGPGGGRPGGGPGRPGGPRPSGGRRAPRSGGRRRRRGEDDLQASTIAYSEDSAPVPEGTVVIERGVSSQEFGPRLNRTAADVVRFLFKNGEIITATMTLNDEQMELFAIEIGAEILLVEPGQQEEMELQALFDDSDDEDEAAQQLRPPVITVMGHVDHGKTTLLDKIRNANVVAGEAGGITQHIGAYQVLQNGKKVTFIDTPGHAAFTQMRARGAQVTDIVVLMVAADDGVMPQTIEAISHARAAGVPMVVAINKVDKENADVQRVLAQLAEQQLVPESWGGDTICVEMSAQQNLGVDDLIEQLTIVAEVEELTANPTGRAKGIVLEANLDTGRGPVATVLVDKGTLRVGDPIVAGGAWGRVRAMIDDKGQQIKEAGPSTPVQVLGLSTVP
ncbi:MAG: translation initiation factor, partial [Actinomycetota bacterium]